jgi:hypothetical protein
MNEEADVNITNCHFSENQADSGGAIFNYYYSEPNVLNCTFRKNTAEFYGGGMRNLWDSHPTVTNCIFWDNTAGSSGDQIYNSGNSGATVTYCDVQGGWGDPNDPNNTNINVDPCFVSAQADDYHLKSDSPCIDAGDPNGDYTDQRDLDGAYRVVGSPNNPGDPNAVIDMGADEQDCFPSGYSTHDDWVEMDRPDCWCASEISPGYQCDGDADGETSGFPDYYRVYTGDNSLLTNNWKKKIDDPSLDPCADMDHKSSGFPYNYRVYTGDLNRLIVNWKKKDADLPGNCPRSE